ncbi:MAG TPA: transposase, partial [Candidatus Contendobacter sp.]|nr:transposase [Candidatus Contendobacter sp.]
MAEHDNSYKLLFSHVELVTDLLRGFVCEPWAARLDLATLEKLSDLHVS